VSSGIITGKTVLKITRLVSGPPSFVLRCDMGLTGSEKETLRAFLKRMNTSTTDTDQDLHKSTWHNAPDYDGKSREIGSEPRHYFGEYPHSMQHWPSVKVRGGVHVELLELYRSVADQGLVEIINCTPGSALDCFEKRDINAV